MQDCCKGGKLACISMKSALKIYFVWLAAGSCRIDHLPGVLWTEVLSWMV